MATFKDSRYGIVDLQAGKVKQVAVGQLLHALADQLVVIAAQGVARHVGFFQIGRASCRERV